jgi:hypothetical protein
LYVLDESVIRPSGRKPLSRSSFHSWPSRPVTIVAVWPGWSAATLVSRQNRSRLKRYGTRSGSLRTLLTVKIDPTSSFSGRPPSNGGLKRGSRHVPVH